MNKFFLIINTLLMAFLGYTYADFRNKYSKTLKKILIINQAQDNKLVDALVQDIRSQASQSKDLHVESINVASLHLPFVKDAIAPALEPIKAEEVQAWGKIVADADAFVFISPNYNNGYPAALKNAIDLIWKPWFNKPVALIGYSITPQDNQEPFMKSWMEVFKIIKTDPINTFWYITNPNNVVTNDTLNSVDNKIPVMVKELFDATRTPSYFKELFRSITDSLKRTIMKLIRMKENWSKPKAA